MKIAVCLLFVVLVVSIEAFSIQAPHSRSKRGFRTGAADRFSHGFGKRTELEDSQVNPLQGGWLRTEDFAELIGRSPKLALLLAKKLDQNDDGFLSEDELHTEVL